MVSARVWQCFCGVAVIGDNLQEHLIEHERTRAAEAGEHFVWFDDTHGCCAYCGGGVSRARAHLHVGNCHRAPS